MTIDPRVIEKLRKSVDIPDVLDDELLLLYKDTFLLANINLSIALADLKKAILNLFNKETK